MKRLAALALLASLSASPARAEFVSGNRLHQWCGSVDAYGQCAGFIMGISDALSGGAMLGEYRACAPATATVQQVVDVAKRGLESMPQLRHHTAARLVAMILSQAFPCRGR